ncbi:MAG: hypothetical protein ACRDT1_15345, partial [Micromonosporaceae bacterium]
DDAKRYLKEAERRAKTTDAATAHELRDEAKDLRSKINNKVGSGKGQDKSKRDQTKRPNVVPPSATPSPTLPSPSGGEDRGAEPPKDKPSDENTDEGVEPDEEDTSEGVQSTGAAGPLNYRLPATP